MKSDFANLSFSENVLTAYHLSLRHQVGHCSAVHGFSDAFALVLWSNDYSHACIIHYKWVHRIDWLIQEHSCHGNHWAFTLLKRCRISKRQASNTDKSTYRFRNNPGLEFCFKFRSSQLSGTLIWSFSWLTLFTDYEATRPWIQTASICNFSIGGRCAAQ